MGAGRARCATGCWRRCGSPPVNSWMRLGQPPRYWTEGHSWLERALSSSLAAPGARRAPALLRAGMLAFRAADYPAAERLYTESLDAYRATGHLSGVAGALYRLGLLAEARGAYEE